MNLRTLLLNLRTLLAAGGILPTTDSGEATRYDPAREVFRLLGAGPDRVRPVGSEAHSRPAPRPVPRIRKESPA